jgi:hypothetical protein
VKVRHGPSLRRPDAAARKLVEPANAFEPIQDGRIYIEKVNEPFLYQLRGTSAEYKGRPSTRDRERLA